jgi:chloride channel protein, CIC family
MADSNGPTSAGSPVAAQPAPAASGGPAAIDPVAVIRSRPYSAALAAILGIPISAIAYGSSR